MRNNLCNTMASRLAPRGPPLWTPGRNARDASPSHGMPFGCASVPGAVNPLPLFSGCETATDPAEPARSVRPGQPRGLGRKPFGCCTRSCAISFFLYRSRRAVSSQNWMRSIPVDDGPGRHIVAFRLTGCRLPKCWIWCLRQHGHRGFLSLGIRSCTALAPLDRGADSSHPDGTPGYSSFEWMPILSCSASR